MGVQGFRSAEEVQRFSDMMDEMCYIVATKHSGSLKACPYFYLISYHLSASSLVRMDLVTTMPEAQSLCCHSGSLEASPS